MTLGSRLSSAWKALRNPIEPAQPAGGTGTNNGTSGPGPASDPQSVKIVLPAVWLVGLASLTLLGLFAAQAPTQRLMVFSVTVMLAAAAVAVGGLLGFLFGIPRSLQDQGLAGSSQQVAADKQQPSYAVNTNLEQISDWLTKILVGVGLIQLARAPGPLGRLVNTLADGLGGQPIHRLMVGAVLVFFLIFGFLVGYLLTRLLLRRAFTLADLAAVMLAATQAARNQVKQQEQHDADAFSLVAHQLQPPPGASPPAQEQLNVALENASPSLRSHVFSLARDQRASHWQDRDKTVMMRTIPVFRALIAADPGFHRNHGQLGYGLKDSQPPDLDGAENELNTAIRLRDDAGEKGWLYYELNRAALNIERDKARQASGKPLDLQDRDAILSDLTAAATNADLRDVIYEDADIQRWLRANAPEATHLLQPAGEAVFIPRSERG